MKAVNNRFTLAFCISVMIGLAGCSQKSQNVQDMILLAAFGHEGVNLAPGKINNLPYASLYAKVEASGQAFLVLGYAQQSYAQQAYSSLPSQAEPINYQLKWLSANNEMLVTEQGRLVKTVNLLSGNLTASYSNDADPLALGLLKPTTPQSWQRKIDWQPSYHIGFTLESRFELQGKNTLMINDEPTQSLHYIEYVFAPELDARFENHFWLHPVSGNVLASVQTLAPGLPSIEITLLKPFSGKGQ